MRHELTITPLTPTGIAALEVATRAVEDLVGLVREAIALLDPAELDHELLDRRAWLRSARAAVSIPNVHQPGAGSGGGDRDGRQFLERQDASRCPEGRGGDR